MTNYSLIHREEEESVETNENALSMEYDQSEVLKLPSHSSNLHFTPGFLGHKTKYNTKSWLRFEQELTHHLYEFSPLQADK